MSNRKLQEFDLYEYGSRGVLRPGDLFRVSGGPYYENEDGSKTLMAERGMFKFRLYCAGRQPVDRSHAGRRGHGRPVGRQGRAKQGSAKLPPKALQDPEGHRAQGQEQEERGGPGSRCRMRGQAKGGQGQGCWGQGRGQGPGRAEDRHGQGDQGVQGEQGVQTAAQTQSQIWVYLGQGGKWRKTREKRGQGRGR